MRRRSSAAFACMRAGISSENSSSRRSGILLLPSPRLRRGGVGGGGSIHVHGGINRQENTRRILQNIVVPEPQHTIALRRKMSCTHRVQRAGVMLAAIDLNNNSQLMTGKSGEVRSDRSRTAKVIRLERRLP